MAILFSWGGGGGLFLKTPPIAAHCIPLLHGNFNQGRGYFLKSPLIAAHCSPLLHGNFILGVFLQKSSHFNPLQPTVTWQFQSGGNSTKVLPMQPTLQWQFYSVGGGNSSKVLPLQSIAAHSYMEILIRGGDNSSKVLPLQHIEAYSYMAILVRGCFLKSPPIVAPCSLLLHGNFILGVILQKSSHCNPLQPTIIWQFQSGANASNVLPMQPTLQWQF